jgi:mRNA interferase HigB
LRIIKRAHLVRFWESRKKDSGQAEKDLTVWYSAAKNANWKDFGALKQTFGSADLVGTCVVFDVGNNRYRLIGRINYTIGVIYVLRVMDHEEYNKKNWIKQCGCEETWPKSDRTPKKPTPQKQKKKGE